MDNYTRPQDKARWGFTESADGKLMVGTEKAGQEAAPFFNPGDTKEDLKNARGNGGGMTKAQLQSELDGLNVGYKKGDSVATLQKLYDDATRKEVDEDRQAVIDALNEEGIEFDAEASTEDLRAKLNAAE